MPPAVPLEELFKAQQLEPWLWALPEPLLVAVLQCLAAPADQRSLFSAARAHSRLHQAAVAALSSIAVTAFEQQRLDDVLLYLSKHGQHVTTLSLKRAAGVVTLHELPPTLQLHSLQLEGFKLQLLPGKGYQGVLRPAAGLSALTQLRLKRCSLPEGKEGLEAALQQLPGLRHLSICALVDSSSNNSVALPLSHILLQQGLQQLTHLELDGDLRRGADQASPALQPLQAFSRLVNLRLATYWGAGSVGSMTASMLSGASGLTCLELEGLTFEPGVLGGKTQLQHLDCDLRRVPGGAGWTELLSQLGSLQQLTHLRLSCYGLAADGTPAAAFSALAASTRLHHLEVRGCTLPAGVWQHVFPAGRQLPHLTALAACDLRRDAVAVSECRHVVSCCPGLRSLNLRGLAYTPGVFAALKGLTGLHTLFASVDSSEALGEVCQQLTGLQALDLDAAEGAGELLLQTTQLRQLTRLDYDGEHNGHFDVWEWTAQAPGDEPVWRQVLKDHLDHSDPAVAQAAAAALEAE